MALSGRLEAQVELKSAADQFYKLWRSETHKMPTISSSTVQGIKVHEGDWDQHGSIKIWNYTVDGKAEVLKEKVEFDDANLTVTINGIEGDMMEKYKVFKPICKVVPKAKGSLALLAIEYEKQTPNAPPPTKHIDAFVSVTKDMDAHISGA